MNTNRIMVVEDERIFALDLRQRLQQAGFNVVGMAASGAEALRQAQQQQPNIVLMDIHLEGDMDGITAATEILQRHRIPVVFLTAYAEDDVIRKAQHSLAYGYLVKPCDTRELVATLGMALARRSAEVAIESSEERLRFALDIAEMGVWEWDRNADRFSAVGPIDSIFGSPAELLNGGVDTLVARVAVEEQQKVMAALQQGVISGCFRSLRADGSQGWLEVHARPFTTANSEQLRIVGVIKDVTSHREAEERLRQASVVFETTAAGLLITDARRRVLSANSAFSLITGLPPHALDGQDPDVMLHLRPHSAGFYQRLLNLPKRQWQGEVMCRRASGEPFPGWEQVSLVMDENNEVSHVVYAISDLSAVRRAEAQLDYLAHHDPLTALPNRLLFNERFEQQLCHAERLQRGFAVIFIDLDDFKLINDSMGHNAGDELLKVIAARIQSTIRRSDTLARLGGDEFVMLLPEVNEPQRCASLAHKVLLAVIEPVLLGSVRVQVSASLGIAFYPHDGQDSAQLLRAADSAMYHAKALGRNRFAFFDTEMAKRAEERLFIEQGVRRALDQHQLELHYQPIFELASGQLVAAEALVRWRHPELGLIPPDRFIAIAESSGLIEPLGLWVLEQACRDARNWQQQGHSAVQVAVNVSPRQCHNPKFDQLVAQVLATTGLAPELLELELTESALQSSAEVQAMLSRLRALNVSLAIDDFGTGYSCLSVLKGLPIQKLKIDRSFTQDVLDDSNSAVLARIILAMGLNLGMKVVAEGIETQAQLEWLLGQQCSLGQGYLLGRPQPLADFRLLLQPPSRH